MLVNFKIEVRLVSTRCVNSHIKKKTIYIIFNDLQVKVDDFFKNNVNIGYTRWVKTFPHPFLLSFILPSWRVVRSYQPHLEERDPIWCEDCSHSLFIRWSPSWDFLGFCSAVRQMPDLCTAPRIISLSPLSLATDVTDATLGASCL